MLQRLSARACRIVARLAIVTLMTGGFAVGSAVVTATPAGADTCGPIRYWYPPANDYVTTGTVCGLVGVAPNTITWTSFYHTGCETGATPTKMRLAWGDGQALDLVLSDPDSDPTQGQFCYSLPGLVLTGQHTYTQAGIFVPSVDRLINGSWQTSASQLWVVRVLASNTAPIAQADSFVVAANQPATLGVLANDSDAETSVSISGSDAASAQGGQVSCSSAVCTYTPANGFVGTDTFSYTIRDELGASASAVVTLTVLDASAVLTGTVTSGGSGVAGATVRACLPTAVCATGLTAGDGSYVMNGLVPGGYGVAVVPPPASSLAASTSVARTLSSNSTTTADFDLTTLTVLPPSATFGSSVPGEVPTVSRGVASAVTTTGCAGGSGEFSVVQNGATLHAGVLVETPGGSGDYVGSIPASSGVVAVVLSVTCPDASLETTSFAAAYIDPSGTVRTPNGVPISGATVTLLQSDSLAGPFTPVPNGSAVMSPANRVNPSITGPDGGFAWDVVAGYYKVRAEKPGCHDPADLAVARVESPTLTIPPPVTDLDLRLACARVSVSDVTISESDAGFRTASFAVTLDEPSAVPVSITYSLVGDSADAGSDFVARGGIVTFKLNSRGVTPVSKPINVKINGDTFPELDETFKVVLSQPSPGLTVQRGVGFGTVRNDDPNGGATLSIGSAAVTEGNVGVRVVKIPITLSSVAAASVSMTVATTSGSATGATRPGPGVDYRLLTKTITIAQGKTSAVLAITLYPDSDVEADETIGIMVSNISGAAGGVLSGSVVIINDD